MRRAVNVAADLIVKNCQSKMSLSAPPVGDRSDREGGNKTRGSADPLCLRGRIALKGCFATSAVAKEACFAGRGAGGDQLAIRSSRPAAGQATSA